jgi:C-terminal processing protease CtpA/Prc
MERKIGYLMYNGFMQIMTIRGIRAFKSEGITDLVLDLRYNGGGSVPYTPRLA